MIETRKDQIAAQNFTVRQRARADLPDASARIDAALAFLSRPDRRRSFADWLRVLIEDLLVIDAATIYPRFTRAGPLTPNPLPQRERGTSRNLPACPRTPSNAR